MSNPHPSTTSHELQKSPGTAVERKRKPRRKTVVITGEIVPPGTLKPNPRHPCAELDDGKTRREAFLDEIARGLAMVLGKTPGSA